MLCIQYNIVIVAKYFSKIRDLQILKHENSSFFLTISYAYSLSSIESNVLVHCR